MKTSRFYLFFILLHLSIGLVSCDKDDEVVNEGNTGERTFAEICKDVSDIDFTISDYYKQCKSIDQLKEYADKIRAIKGVEEVYFNEATTMFVKIKDFRTISYSYFPEPDERAFETMNQVAKRAKAAAEAQEDDVVYSYQAKEDYEVLIVNQQSKEMSEGRIFEREKLYSGIQERFTKSGLSNLRIENEPDAEFFRNGIFDCDYLFLITHGIYDPKEGLHWLATAENISRDNKGKIDPTFLKKFQNYKEDEVRFDKYTDNTNVVVISEKYIASSSKQFIHPGQAIVFNTACQSMQGPSSTANDSINYSLARVFNDKGAGTYLGYDETNTIGPVGGFEFWERLLSGMSIESAFNDLSFVIKHNLVTEKEHWYSSPHSFWADLVLYAPYMKDVCINRPDMAYVDLSNDDGLQINLYASIFSEHVQTTYYDKSAKTGSSMHFDNQSEIPYKYGFELSESEKFTDISSRVEKHIEDEGCTWVSNMFEMTQSLTYNASESNSLIKPETTYWARAYVYDGSGYNYSEPLTFTTGKYERIDQVVPSDIREQMEPYIDIYDGNNPPNIEGEFVVSPMELVHSTQGFSPGDIFADLYIKFYNQNIHNNTLDYKEKQSSSEATGTGAFISGEGSNFSVFFNTEGVSHFSDYDIIDKTALIISGTKVEGGISNLQYAFVMVEKSDDPSHHVIDVGVFRVFHDQDGFSPVSNWYSAKRRVGGYNPTLPSYLDYDR